MDAKEGQVYRIYQIGDTSKALAVYRFKDNKKQFEEIGIP